MFVGMPDVLPVCGQLSLITGNVFSLGIDRSWKHRRSMVVT
jgi:hypothetical protein